jgi:long-subunit acyl-CoA synthetase (AMP-forming)/acyl carrier protein
MREYKDVQKFVDTAELLKSSSKTLRDIYEIATTLHAKEKAALYFDEDGRKQTYTYERYKSLCYYCAKHLSSLLSGVPAGSLVALKMRNSPNWPLLFWGLEMSGHPTLLIDAKLAHENTENLLRQSGASAILVNEEEPYGVPSFRLNEVRNAEEDDQFAPRWANEVIFCSSGTTGAAKMMVYEGHCLCDQIYSAKAMPKETLDILHAGKTNILAMVPLHHIFGFCATFLWYTFYGKCFVYPTSMATRDLLMAIHRAPVTHLYSVPMFWDAIAQSVERTASLKGERSKRVLDNMIAYNCHQISREEAGKGAWSLTKKVIQKKALGTAIEYCISGGGYLSPKTANIINGLGYPLYNGYGMTEIGVSSVELSPRVEDRLKGSIGHPLVGVRYKIEENPNSANHNQGQLWVASPVLHTEEIIGGVRKKTELKDGYYPTGDIAEVDASGSYYIKGRIKDTIINSNGENVYPDEIETYFKDVKHVVNDVVVGIKEGLNEKIVLILELDNTVQPSDLLAIKADVDAINAKLPNEKKVQETLIYKKTMPLANNMKVKRYVLRDALSSGHSEDFTTFEGPRRAISFVGYDPQEVKDVMEQVRSVFSKTLLLPEFKIADDAVWTTDLGGDSMSYVSMVSDLNDAFGLVVPTEEYGRLTCVKDFTLEILELRHSSSSQQK